jgi:nucleoredoxin
MPMVNSDVRAFLAIIVFLFAFTIYRCAQPPVANLEGRVDQVVVGALLDAEGEHIDAERVRDKYVLVYFSAGWCGTCREFTPDLVEFYQQNNGGERFEVVFVSQDRSESRMQQYIHEDEMPWLSVAWDTQPSRALQHRFCGRYIPDAVLFDSDGNVVSASNRDGEYVGPWEVLRDLEGTLSAVASR